MKKFAYTESQKGIISSILASLEDIGTRFPELEQVEVIDSAPTCGHVADFLDKMDVLFKRYKKDGCLDRYHRDGNFLTVGKKDAAYMWAALDGAVHLYNMVHPGNELVADNYRTTDVSETFIVQYVVDYE